MLSMLKMDIVRLVKNKYFYLSTLVFIIFIGICIYMQNNEQIIRGYQELPSEQYVGFQFTINYRLTSVLHFVYGFGLKYSMLIFGIFMITFISNEYNSGFIKNTCMMYKNRNVIILNKLYIIIFLSIFISIITFACCSIFAYLFVEDFVFGSLTETVSYLGIMTVVNIAYLSLLLLICTLTRNKTITIVFALLLTLGFTDALYQTIFNVLHMDWILDYTLSHITMTLPMVFDSVESARDLLISGFFILIFSFISMIVINKRDI